MRRCARIVAENDTKILRKQKNEYATGPWHLRFQQFVTILSIRGIIQGEGADGAGVLDVLSGACLKVGSGHVSHEGKREENMIGMDFVSFLILLIISVVVSGVVHFALKMYVVTGWRSYVSKVCIGWVGAWIVSGYLEAQASLFAPDPICVEFF